MSNEEKLVLGDVVGFKSRSWTRQVYNPTRVVSPRDTANSIRSGSGIPASRWILV